MGVCACHTQVLEKLLLAGYEADTLGGPCDDSTDAGLACTPPAGAALAPGKAALQPQTAGADGGAAAAPATDGTASCSSSSSSSSSSGSTGASAAAGGHTALHLAASQGHCAAVAVLLQHGGAVCVGRRDWRGCTPLLRAAEGGHRGAFELLLMVRALCMRDGAMYMAVCMGHYCRGEVRSVMIAFCCHVSARV